MTMDQIADEMERSLAAYASALTTALTSRTLSERIRLVEQANRASDQRWKPLHTAMQEIGERERQMQGYLGGERIRLV